MTHAEVKVFIISEKIVAYRVTKIFVALVRTLNWSLIINRGLHLITQWQLAIATLPSNTAVVVIHYLKR